MSEHLGVTGKKSVFNYAVYENLLFFLSTAGSCWGVSWAGCELPPNLSVPLLCLETQFEHTANSPKGGWMGDEGGLGFTGPLVLSGSLLVTQESVCTPQNFLSGFIKLAWVTLLKMNRLDVNRGALLNTIRVYTLTEISYVPTQIKSLPPGMCYLLIR